MHFLLLLHRHGITESDMDIIAASMLDGLGLFETSDKFDGRLSPEQIYAVATSYAKEEFSESLSEICPQMKIDRIAINSKKNNLTEQQKFINAENKRFKGIEEDLLMLEAERAA